MIRIRLPYSRHTTTMAGSASISTQLIRSSIQWLDRNHQRRMTLEFCQPYDEIAVAQLRLCNRRHLERLRQATASLTNPTQWTLGQNYDRTVNSDDNT